MKPRNQPLTRILAFTTLGLALASKIAAGVLILTVYAILVVMLIVAFIRSVEYIFRIVD